jgi:hypothetical protein
MRFKTKYVVKLVHYPIFQGGERFSQIEGEADTFEKARGLVTEILPWTLADDSQKVEYFNSQLIRHYEIEKLKVEDNRYCENCSHWVRTGMSQSGECRRHSPQIVGVPLDRFGNIDVKSYFPEISQSEWCGEWNIKDEV